MGKYVKEAGRRCRRFESRKVEPQPRPDTSGMSSVWDTVYGSAFYVSHVLGKKFYAQGSASGNHGTVVQSYSSVPFLTTTPQDETLGERMHRCPISCRTVGYRRSLRAGIASLAPGSDLDTSELAPSDAAAALKFRDDLAHYFDRRADTTWRGP